MDGPLAKKIHPSITQTLTDMGLQHCEQSLGFFRSRSGQIVAFSQIR